MKKYILLLIFLLTGLVGIVLFFYYFGHHDEKALTEFSAAYENYDRLISGLSNAIFASKLEGTPVMEDLEQNADLALANLNTKASVRISSLTRHDAEIMSLTEEIADLSGRELAVIKEYQRAVSDNVTDLNNLKKEWEDLSTKRQAAFARYQELGGD